MDRESSICQGPAECAKRSAAPCLARGHGVLDSSAQFLPSSSSGSCLALVSCPELLPRSYTPPGVLPTGLRIPPDPPFATPAFDFWAIFFVSVFRLIFGCVFGPHFETQRDPEIAPTRTSDSFRRHFGPKDTLKGQEKATSTNSTFIKNLKHCRPEKSCSRLHGSMIFEKS